MIENLQRKDVDALDVAEALKKIFDMRSVQPLHGSKQTHKEYTITQFAEEMEQEGIKGKREVLNYLSLLNLAPEVQEMVSDGKLGAKLASQLATVSSDRQLDTALGVKELPTEDLQEKFIKNVKEYPEKKPKEILEEVFPTKFVKFEIRTPEREVFQFEIPLAEFKILYKVAERTKKSISELINEIIEEKLKEWNYK